MFCCARPATRRMGCVYSRSSCSISASRMSGSPLARSCGAAGPTDAANAAAGSAVAPFMVMDVMAAAARLEAQGRRIVHMEVGQPAAPPPSSAIAAARGALETTRIGYTEALGIASLRARIARHYAETYDH